MSTIRCPKCGEEYSDTYKKCPFCQEEEAIRQGKPLRRRGGKRLDKRKRSAGAGGVMLIVTAVIIIGVVGFVFFGDQVAGLMGIRTEQNQTDDTPDTVQTGQDDTQTPATPDDEGDDISQEPDVPQEPAGPLALDRDSMTIPAGETALLTATGGTGDVTWTSSNENIATVANGSVTGVAGGTVTITAAAGEETVTCSVTVTGDPWVSSANLSLNRTDFTIRSIDPPTFQMEVSGTDSPVTWSIDNTSVATISADGLVTKVGSGIATITATVDGQTLTCIVRVSLAQQTKSRRPVAVTGHRAALLCTLSHFLKLRIVPKVHVGEDLLHPLVWEAVINKLPEGVWRRHVVETLGPAVHRQEGHHGVEYQESRQAPGQDLPRPVGDTEDDLGHPGVDVLDPQHAEHTPEHGVE